MGGTPWGGSEELWSQTALRLHAEGHQIIVSVHHWPEPPPAICALRARGIPVQERHPGRPSKLVRAAHRLRGKIAPNRRYIELADLIRTTLPDLVCVSNGVCVDDLEGIEVVARSGRPWCNIAQCGVEWFWPLNTESVHAPALFDTAIRWFFVADQNRRLFENQWGVQLRHPEIVRNPFKVGNTTDLPWPDERQTRLACVARLDPVCKGQDLLLDVLALKKWRERPVAVSLFGSGERSRSIERQIKRLGLSDRVSLCGHVHCIEDIWRDHHALIMPSRHEGLPLALVEAMLCARPAIVTDVGGNRELVEDSTNGFLASAPTVYHVDEALERAWAKRNVWRELGLAAQIKVRSTIPPDPVGAFAQRLLEIANSSR